MSPERWAPWDQAESEAIIDHRKAAGGKVETPTVGAHDWVALACWMIRKPGVLSDARCCRLKFLAPQGVEQVAHENDALTLAPGEPLPDQVLDASIHGAADLPAEAGSTQ